MKLEELIYKRDELKIEIKSILLKIEEIRNLYLPGHNSDVVIKSSGGISPQEVMILKIDALERDLAKLQNEEENIENEINVFVKKIKDNRSRWIVTQRLSGKSWKEIECNGLSVPYIRKLFKESIDNIRSDEYDMV